MGSDDPADTYGSDITRYPDVQDPGLGERIMNGTPVVKSASHTARSVYDAMAGDDRLASAAAIPGAIGMMGVEALLAVRDPIYWLSSVGLTMVLEIVEPFNDLLELISGDPGEMEHQQQVWGQVSSALKALSGETGQAVSGGIPGWSGQDADAAGDQLQALEASVLAASQEAQGVQTMLGWCKTLAETIYAVVKSILAELVSWLITRGLMALAASSFTFGASMASFVISASLKGFQMFERAMAKMQQGQRIFRMIANSMMKFLGKNSFRSAAMTGNGYALWKGVLIKAGIGIAAGGLPGVKEQATNAASGAVKDAMGGDRTARFGSVGGRGISAHPEEFDAAAGKLEGLGGNADAILNVATQTAAAPMTWGLPGALGLEDKYSDNCEGLVEAISHTKAAYDGHASRLRECGENYRRAEESITAGLRMLHRAFA